MNEETQKSILQMAHGAIQERTDYEMSRLLDNILDVNTSATAKRKLTITLELKPDDNRQNVIVSCTAKPVPAITNPVTTALYITGKTSTGEICAVEMVPQIPGQCGLDGNVQEPAPTLKLVKFA